MANSDACRPPSASSSINASARANPTPPSSRRSIRSQRSQPTNSTAPGTINPCYQRHDPNCNCTAIAPKLQSNCSRIAPELQQNASNCTQLQQKHIGVGGGGLQHEATQPRGTANWCNRVAKPPAGYCANLPQSVF